LLQKYSDAARRTRVLFAVVCGALIPASHGHAADNPGAFPVRAVRWIVPFPPAGSIDLVGRVVGQKLFETWGQQVVIDNRSGGGGRLGTQTAAAATPDGYTQLFTLNTSFTIDRSLFKSLPYDPDKAFAPITIIASTSQLLVTNPSFPVKNVRELIALARARPGEVNYGSSGAGGSLHLAMELFKSMTGIEIVHVPYKGGPPAATDLIAGQIELLFFNTPAALPYIKAGKLRALGVSTAQRTPLLPDVPTIAESGVAGFDIDVWFGLVAPAGTPADIVAKTHRDVARIVALPDVRKQLLDIGADPVANTPEEFAARIKRESALWARVVHTAKINFD
jgi:tripartite-type tricarboxylate transporter receptor subunit TctC